jgi:SP family sugar:H+ symporter-like MFS transporter
MLRLLPLVITATLGGFLFGFDSGVINGTVESLQRAFHSDNVGTGFNVASMLLGCALGALLAGALADRHGRKPILLATAAAFIISAWGSGAVDHAAPFVLYRVLGGLAVGAASVICPAYIGEIAPPRARGRLIALQQFMIVLGLFASFLNNWLIARAAGSPDAPLWLGHAAWRWMFWAELAPALLFLLALTAIPESPRFLAAAGRHARAAAVFRRVAPADDPAENIRRVAASLTHRPRLADLLDPLTRHPRKLVLIGAALAALQQLSGINIVFYYGATLWQAAGFSTADALLTNVITGAVNILSTLAAIALVDRVGRRPLLLAGSAGMTLTLGVLALLFAAGTTSTTTTVTAAAAATGATTAASAAAAATATGATGATLTLGPIAGPAALIVANLFVVCFGVTWGPVVWTLLGEMFPTQFRGAALSLAGLSLWLANFAVTMTFPVMLSALGLGLTYGLYTAAAALSLRFVWKHIAETKGRPLEEMIN